MNTVAAIAVRTPRAEPTGERVFDDRAGPGDAFAAVFAGVSGEGEGDHSAEVDSGADEAMTEGPDAADPLRKGARTLFPNDVGDPRRWPDADVADPDGPTPAGIPVAQLGPPPLPVALGLPDAAEHPADADGGDTKPREAAGPTPVPADGGPGDNPILPDQGKAAASWRNAGALAQKPEADRINQSPADIAAAGRTDGRPPAPPLPTGVAAATFDGELLSSITGASVAEPAPFPRPSDTGRPNRTGDLADRRPGSPVVVTDQRTHFAPAPFGMAAPPPPVGEQGPADAGEGKSPAADGDGASGITTRARETQTSGPPAVALGAETGAVTAPPLAATSDSPGALVRTVADAVVNAAQDRVVADRVAQPHPSMPAQPAVVREIAVTVDLGALGGLTVRMTVNGPSLTLRLTAERDETVHALHRDRAALEHILEGAGYDADIVAIAVRAPDVVGNPPAPTPPGPMDGGIASGDPSGRGSEGRPRAEARFGGDDADGGDTPGPGDRSVRGLYV